MEEPGRVTDCLPIFESHDKNVLYLNSTPYQSSNIIISYTHDLPFNVIM